jgi:PhnB protein
MTSKNPIPQGYHSLNVYFTVKNAAKAIEFYKNAFGATEVGRITMPGDVIGHAELQIGNSRLMLAEEMPEWGNKSPQNLGGSPASVVLYVEDADTVYQQALDAGAKVQGGMTVKDQFYGDRSGNLVDPFGHIWIISTKIEELSYEEMQKRSDDLMKKQ